MYDKLRKKRESLGLTQEEVAKALGYQSKNAYSLKERGVRKFNLEEAKQVADIFYTSIDDLFFEEKVTI